MMVLSSVSPLIVLWAIRGTQVIPETYFLGACSVMVLCPNALLWLRIRIAKRTSQEEILTVGQAEDRSEHILLYLFAMLLPIYAGPIATDRALAASLAALALVVWVFWHLNLHYMNILLTLFGYRVYTWPRDAGQPGSGVGVTCSLITRRMSVTSGLKVTAYRVSDTVYLEEANEP
ncbi:MAG: hypothetical protein ACYCOU_12965 [Sulfobacillus sp.]